MQPVFSCQSKQRTLSQGATLHHACKIFGQVVLQSDCRSGDPPSGNAGGVAQADRDSDSHLVLLLPISEPLRAVGHLGLEHQSQPHQARATTSRHPR